MLSSPTTPRPRRSGFWIMCVSGYGYVSFNFPPGAKTAWTELLGAHLTT
ncbi:hypothetical protein BZL30_9476 [Mycobacterium kansasii]|uniref:Uncharacterized protein n=1 Tax=Mycobacterium kansasii TaxID=1768 RepID=A0A1V3W9J7_MYCKA|nr:hypothetical protein BZL30_9476 [Mycobacterium kansasii]